MFRVYDKNGSIAFVTDCYKKGKLYCLEFGGTVKMQDGTTLYSVSVKE